LANLTVVGYGRLALFGPHLSLDPRYNAEMAFLLPITLVLAFLPNRRSASARWLPRPSPRVWAAAAAVALAAYVVSSANAYTNLMHSWDGERSHAWADELRASVADLRANGIEPKLLDVSAPFPVIAAAMPPVGLLSMVIPSIDASLQVVATGDDLYVPDESGRVVPVTFTDVWSAEPVAAKAQGVLRVDQGSVRPRGDALCATSSLQAVLTIATGRRTANGTTFVAVQLADATPLQLTVLLDRGQGYTGLPVAVGFDSTHNTGRSRIDPGTLQGVQLQLPQGACVKRIALQRVQ
jgi:hypothetical protein